MPPLASMRLDAPRWRSGEDDAFSVSAAYGIQTSLGSSNLVSDLIWSAIAKYKGKQRIKVFLWLVCGGRLLTNDERYRRHHAADAHCVICNNGWEDVNHILGQCSAVIKPNKLQEFLADLD
ncbi:hypothetical protein V6N13_052946 [Hibiscus sabdariffa]|uniref:Reverse transcriptase zinc-binding domain-containing protein n=1 Tax=Hibiscus sabdariffa TaxID=183260 RepID=A0ABR2AUG1_9ROSI